MKLSKLINDYYRSSAYRGLTTNSKTIYKYGLEKLIDELGDREADQIKRSDLIKFSEKFSKTPAAVNVSLRAISVVFTYGMDHDVVQFNPASRMKKMKVGSHKRWSIMDVKKLVGTNDRRVSTAVALAWYTGQREGDILSMKWADYKDGHLRISQQKTKVELKIKVHPDLVGYLDGIRGDSPDDHYIVSGAKRLNPSTFRFAFKQRAMDVGVKKVFHGIRKGVACALAESGRPISEIAAMLGHKSIRMTAYYVEQADNAVLIDSAVSNVTSVTVQEPC